MATKKTPTPEPLDPVAVEFWFLAAWAGLEESAYQLDEALTSDGVVAALGYAKHKALRDSLRNLLETLKEARPAPDPIGVGQFAALVAAG